MAEISGIILSGGDSSRMGKNKAFLKKNGKYFIDIAIDLLSGICDHIMISANNNELDHLGYPVINDEITGKGPMVGVYSCLKKSETLHNITIPVDTPYMSINVYEELLKWKDDFEHIVAANKDMLIEPLHAYYNRNVYHTIGMLLENDNFKMQDISKYVNTKLICFNESFPFFHDRLFYNLNKKSDIGNTMIF